MDEMKISICTKERLNPIIMSPPFKFKRHDMNCSLPPFRSPALLGVAVCTFTRLLSTGIKQNFHETFMCPAHFGRTQIPSVTYTMAHVLIMFC